MRKKNTPDVATLTLHALIYPKRQKLSKYVFDKNLKIYFINTIIIYYLFTEFSKSGGGGLDMLVMCCLCVGDLLRMRCFCFGVISALNTIAILKLPNSREKYFSLWR